MIRVLMIAAFLFSALASAGEGQVTDAEKKGFCNLGGGLSSIKRPCQTDDHCIFDEGCYDLEGRRVGGCEGGECPSCICTEGLCAGRACDADKYDGCSEDFRGQPPISEKCSCFGKEGEESCRNTCKNDRNVECFDHAHCGAPSDKLCDLGQAVGSQGLICVESGSFECTPKADLQITQDCNADVFFATSIVACVVTIRNIGKDMAVGNRLLRFLDGGMASSGGFWTIDDLDSEEEYELMDEFRGNTSWRYEVASETNDPDLTNNKVEGQVPLPFGFGIRGYLSAFIEDDGGDEPWPGIGAYVSVRLSRRFGLQLLFGQVFDVELADNISSDGAFRGSSDFEFGVLSAQIFLGSSAERWSLELGAGLYDIEFQDQSEGFSLGARVDLYETDRWSLESSGSLHLIDAEGSDLRLVTVGLGVRFGR